MSIFLGVLLLVVVSLGVLYVRALMKRVQALVLGWFSLRTTLVEYRMHLDRVYKLPTFYKDPTLEELMEHTSFLEGAIEDFERDTYLVQLFKESDVAQYEQEASELEQESGSEEQHAENDEQKTVALFEEVKQVY